MTDIPVGSHRSLAVTDKAHGVQQAYVLADGISDGGIVFLSRVVGEVDAAASPVAKLFILTIGVVDGSAFSSHHCAL
jgi:hypothetical protein